MKRKTTAGIALLAALALGSTACAAGGADAPDASDGPASADLRVTLIAPPNSLDPKDAIGGPFAWYLEPAYAGLLAQDENGELVAGLATEWGYVGEGNTRFELTIREDAKFDDGSPVTVDDIVESFTRYQGGTGPDVNLYAGWKMSKIDETHVGIDLPQPNPMVAYQLTGKSLGSLAVSKAGRADEQSLAQDTYGAGPYALDEKASRPGELYVYTPNEYYWDQDAINYDSITVQVIPNQAQQLQAMEAGQVQAMSAVPSLAKNLPADIKVASGPYTWNGLQIFDMDGKQTPALGEVKVRQAMNHAIDRAAIVQAVWGEFGTPSASFTAPADPVATGADPALDDAYPYDVEKAKRLMAEAGYADGFDLTVTIQQGVVDQATVGQILSDQFGAIGIRVTLQELSQADWVQATLAGNVPTTIVEGSPYFFMQVVRQFLPGPLNVFQNTFPPQIAQPFGAFMAASAEDAGPLAVEINRQLVDYAAAVPIGQFDSITLYRDEVAGVGYVNSPLVTSITLWHPAE